MNHFSINVTKDEHGQPTGPHKVLIHVTAGALGMGFSQFLQHFEVPILQGHREAWGEGGMMYEFELNDEDAQLFSQALTMAFYGVPPLN